jgi:hypothetical protein
MMGRLLTYAGTQRRVVLQCLLMLVGIFPMLHVQADAVRNVRVPVVTSATRNPIPAALRSLGSTGGTMGGTGIASVGVDSDGRYTYLAEGAGLTIISVENASSPARVARLPLPALALDVALQDSVAYVAAQDGLYIIDVSNPALPEQRGQYVAAGGFNAVDVVAGRAYLTAEGVYSPTMDLYLGRALRILDTSNLTAPRVLGVYETQDRLGNIEVVAGLAYIAGHHGFRIVDVAEDARPILRATFSMPDTIVSSIQVAGSHAFAAYINWLDPHGGGLQIVDISDPAQPVARGNFSAQRVQDVKLRDNLAYLTAGRELLVVNVVNPSQPALVTKASLEALGASLTVVNTQAHVVMPAHGLQIVDIGDTMNLVLLGRYWTIARVEALGPDAVEVSGDVAYVLEAYDAYRLALIDIRDHARPRVMGKLQLSQSSRSIEVVGNVTYVVDEREGLQIIDVSDPFHPALRGRYLPPSSYLADVRVIGNHAYVTCGCGLLVLDVSNPDEPQLVGQLSDIRSMERLDVVGNLLYVITLGRVHIVDITSPRTPRMLGFYSFDSPFSDVEVDNGFMYVTKLGYYRTNSGLHSQGLDIVDVRDAAHPQLLATYQTHGPALAVEVQGNVVYVSDRTTVDVVDVSVPDAPMRVAHYATPGSADALELDSSRNLLFVGDHQGGLHILRFTPVLSHWHFLPLVQR